MTNASSSTVMPEGRRETGGHIDRKSASAMSLVTFFLLTYAITWTSWLAADAVSGSGATSPNSQSGLRILFIYIGTFAPSFVALSLIGRHEGGAGVRAMLRRLVQWRVGVRWYVFALTYIAGTKLTAALIYRLATGEWPRFGEQPFYLLLAATLVSTFVLGQAGEEIGWRGYALPRLAQRLGLPRGSLLLGVIWAVWHLPLFLIPGTDTTGQSFPLFLLQVTALSVIIAWLYAKTNGSLLLTMLFHAAVNNTKDIVPSAVQGATNPFALSTSLLAWITVGLLWLTAACFLVRMPKLNLRISL